MQRRGLILSILFVPTLATACIVTKDMEDDDTAGSSDSGSSATNPTTDAGTTTTDGASGTSNGVGSDGSEGTTSSLDTDGSGGTTTSEGSTGSDSSGDTGSDDAALCEATGGTWDPVACGHYACGLPNRCAAVIPGCDCGPTMGFVEGTGCAEDEACLEATFACGDDLECSLVSDYCEIFHPGVPGPPSYSCQAIPNACVAAPSCRCLDGEGIPGPAGECTAIPGGGLEVEIFGA